MKRGTEVPMLLGGYNMLGTKNMRLHHNPHINGCCGNGGENCCGSHNHDHIHLHTHEHGHEHEHINGLGHDHNHEDGFTGVHTHDHLHTHEHGHDHNGEHGHSHE